MQGTGSLPTAGCREVRRQICLGAELWAALPPVTCACIECRTIDSLAGMASALDAGERYEAALLDSIHTAQHTRLS